MEPDDIEIEDALSFLRQQANSFEMSATYSEGQMKWQTDKAQKCRQIAQLLARLAATPTK